MVGVGSLESAHSTHQAQTHRADHPHTRAAERQRDTTSLLSLCVAVVCGLWGGRYTVVGRGDAIHN